MVELLKQPQYQPMPVEEQVVSLYCGTKGYMDDLEVEQVSKFEREMLEFMRNQKAEILSEIREKETMDEEMNKKVGAAIDEFKKGFKA
jgi:F-type H+-transporting ATPase subunit alpha